MDENVNAQLTSISKASTLEEIGEYWDTHSLADHWDETHEVAVVVRAKRGHQVMLDPDLYSRVEAKAKERGIQLETLVNLWLSERLHDKVLS